MNTTTVNEILTIDQVISRASELKGCKFVSFTYRAKESGELARHLINVGVDMNRVYQEDLALVESLILAAKRQVAFDPLRLEAMEEIRNSLAESLTVGIGNNSAYTQKGIWEHVCKGVKYNPESGTFQFAGMSVSKTVIEPGVHKVVNSRPKTVIKNEIRKMLKSSKYRNYCLTPDNAQVMKIKGDTIEF